MSEKGKALAEINDHVAVERNHQAMAEIRMGRLAIKDQVAAKARANDQEMTEVRIGLAAIKHRLASSEENSQAMRVELAELKDLIYANSGNNQAITETKLETAELKNLIYANFGEEDKAIIEMRDELAETKNQVSALETSAWEQDNRIFAKAMENEQTMTDTQRELHGIRDRFSALDDKALEHDGRGFREVEESEMRNGEMGRVEERVLEKGHEVCSLGVKVAGVDEEISVQKRDVDPVGEKVARWERIIGRLRKEGVFD